MAQNHAALPARLSDFDTLNVLHSDDQRMVWNAVDRSSGRPVRLTVFSSSVSASAGFRRAFKTDRVMLETLRHQCVVGFLGDGESDGQLFFWTEPGLAQTSATGHAGRREYSVEDISEIGWQVCSALQQAHNLGLSHGGLNRDSVHVSDLTEVALVDFGVRRWLQAADSTASSLAASGETSIASGTSAWRREVQADLRDLAAFLQDLLETDPAAESAAPLQQSPDNALAGSLRRLLEPAAAAASDLDQPVSARDMQGRLGELLIGGNKDQMILVDQREHLPTSRRSIVEELFDKGDTRQRPIQPHPPSTADTQRRQWHILPICVAAILLLILLLIAVQTL